MFVTKEKESGATPYEDELNGNILYMMGQEKHRSDSRLLENMHTKKDKIYLFYRNLHHTPFVYYGRCFVINAELHVNKPSEFQFLIEHMVDEAEDDMILMDCIVSDTNNDNQGKNYQIAYEGIKKIANHVRYERNPKNRKEAIRLHGHSCKICGFDFNKVYGNDLADSYIEVHHVKRLADGIQLVNPETDLLPVCANCHRMLHRKKQDNLTSAELIERVKEYYERITGAE